MNVAMRALLKNEADLGMLAIATLFRDSHILARNRDFFQWQFGAFNQEGELGFWVAETENKIVGCIGGVAVDCHVYGQRFPGVITSNYAVSPDYRRGGLALRLLDISCRDKMLMAMNVSAINILMCQQIRGMHIMDALPRYVCIADRGKLAELLDAYGNGRAVIEDYDSVSQFEMKAKGTAHKVESLSTATLQEWDHCWNHFLAPALRGVAKDAAYIQWRYLDHPVFKYTALIARDAKRDICGLTIVRKVGLPNGMSVLRVLEFLSTNPDAGAALACGVGELVGDDVVYLESLCLGRRWEPLSHIGVGPANGAKFSYYFAPPNLDFCDVSAVLYSNGTGISAESFCTGDDTYITIGDSDVDVPYLPR